MNTSDLFERLQQELDDQRYPPVLSWHPSHQGRIDIRIDADGRWFHEGEPIKRTEIVRLFASILRRDDDGYVLVTPAERLLIEVEDVPFLAVDFEVRGGGSEQTDFIFTTNVGDLVFADRDHPIWMSSGTAPKPYLRVRSGLDARITRAAYYRMLEHAQTEAGRVYVVSGDTRFLLGSAA